MATRAIDWASIDADPRFQALHRKKVKFLGLLMGVSIAYYFLLPVGAAYFPELFRIRVFGVVNAGILFALSEFLVAWVVAALYTWRANREFDRLTEEINQLQMARSIQGRQL
ncbi:MAG: DUF485 domain-containing protein [Rhodocyclaceae bacterium]